MEKSIIQHGLDNLEQIISDKREIEASELHHCLYNEDYFVIGTYEATEMLEQYGTFKAIEEVREYKMDNFGEFTTEISPEQIINMLAYIKGEYYLNECKTLQNNWDNILTQKQLKAIYKELEAQL